VTRTKTRNAPRVVVIGDGIAGIAAAALIPGALLFPSQPPQERAAALDVPFTPGPRFLHVDSGALDLLLVSGLGVNGVEEIEYPILWRSEGKDVLASQLPPMTRLAYYTKSRPGVKPRVEDSTGSAGADVLRVMCQPGYFEVISALKAKLTDEERIRPYVQMPMDPDPDAPPEIGGETFDVAIYTCPPNALWPDFPVVSADKLFLPVRVEGDLRDIVKRGARYRYRPDPEVPWHRETIGSIKMGGRGSAEAAILEWTLPPGDMPPEGWAKPYGEPAAAADAVARGLRPLDAPFRLRGGQVLPSPRPAPFGQMWRPLGRVATRTHGALVTDVARDALRYWREIRPSAPDSYEEQVSFGA
jgi:hypothetical protein